MDRIRVAANLTQDQFKEFVELQAYYEKREKRRLSNSEVIQYALEDATIAKAI